MRCKDGFVVIAAVGLLSGVWASEGGNSTPVGFTGDFAAAKAEAAKTNKKIVAVFSGSDWSENVRTNKTLETCAGFRERKLRPFLLKEMDPAGKATPEELKILNAAIDAAWGEDGFKAFEKKKELVVLLDRLAKKPFADMVKAFVEKKNARLVTVAWIESGKFADEDLRAVACVSTARPCGCFR